jgi:DNA-directed RNA polymerase specialized sigma24 family protein
MYSDILYGLLLKIVQNEELAESLLRDLFVHVWKNMASYQASKGSLIAWMTGIARRMAITSLQTSVKGNTTFSVLPETVQIREMMRKLDAGTRQVVDLLYLEGRTPSDVERRLAIDPATLRNRVRSAVQNLRLLDQSGTVS